MLRVGEFTLGGHTLKTCDIHVGDKKDKVMVVLYSSKTHGKESRPQKIRISAQPSSISGQSKSRHFCPFKIVIQYLVIRGKYISNSEQLFIFRDRTPLKPNHVRAFLGTLLDRLNLDSSLYDVHRLRIERTCDLFKFEFRIDQIKEWGRWKSNAVDRYLKN